MQLKKDWSIIKPGILICANSYPPQVGGLATYLTQLDQNLAKFNFDGLLGDAANSPIVEDRGTANQFRFGLGFSYRF